MRTLWAALTAAVMVCSIAPVVGPVAASAQVSSSGPSPTPTNGGPTTTLPPPAKAELLVDLNTGRVLLAKNAHAQLPPASLTKLVTALVAQYWLPPNRKIWVSPQAATAYPDDVGMKARQIWPLSVAMRAMLIDSANDAAYAIATEIGPGIPRFGGLMTAASAQMGMTDHPVFHDPAGLDGSEGYKGGNTMSAWDVAIAARNVLANSTLRGIVGTRKYRFKGPDGIVYALTNKNHYFLDTYPGAIGLKTGFTDPAGLCIAAAATRAGRTLLAVVLNGASTYQTAEDLLNKGFAVPAKSEPRSAPLLPPVREPRPPPKPTSTTTTVTTSPSAPPQLAAGSLHSATRPHVRLTPLEGIDLAAILLAAGLIVVQFRRRRRRRPAGAHSMIRARRGAQPPAPPERGDPSPTPGRRAR